MQQAIAAPGAIGQAWSIAQAASQAVVYSVNNGEKRP
jgi:hypothetical protein